MEETMLKLWTGGPTGKEGSTEEGVLRKEGCLPENQCLIFVSSISVCHSATAAILRNDVISEEDILLLPSSILH